MVAPHVIYWLLSQPVLNDMVPYQAYETTYFLLRQNGELANSDLMVYPNVFHSALLSSTLIVCILIERLVLACYALSGH